MRDAKIERVATMSPALILFTCLGLALAGCAGGAQQTGIDISQDLGAGIIRNISAADLKAIKDTCAVSAPALDAAVGVNAPSTVKDVAVYPAAFCKQVVAGDLGTANTNSLAWLQTVLTYIKTAATIAGYVLPFVLPLL